MKARNWGLIAAIFLALIPCSPAATLYVDLNSTAPAAPYSSWSTAATNIQNAIDAASTGDLVLVTNGVYQAGGRQASGYPLTNRIIVSKAIAVQSINGPGATTIQGYQVPGTTNGFTAIRCAYLANGASLTGFSLVDGATFFQANAGYPDNEGAGIYCASTNVHVTNCVIENCVANFAGGGVYSGTFYNCTIASNWVYTGGSPGAGGGGSSGSTLVNCALTGNYSLSGGGALSSTLTNCTLSSNWGEGGAWSCTLVGCTLTGNTSDNGGGASYSVLNNCVVAGNFGTPALSVGGGVYNCALTNCTLVGNASGWRGGGAYGGTLINCLVISNTVNPGLFTEGGAGAYAATLDGCLILSNGALPAGTSGLTGGGAVNCLLNNCTVVGNIGSPGGTLGGSAGGTMGGTNNNCIIMFNYSSAGSIANYIGGTFNYCDTTPLPGNGIGNISANPQLSDTYHLAAFSPCRSAGSALYTIGVDLDGNPWLNPPSIGCDEYYGLTPLAVSVSANYTNVVTGYPVRFMGNVSGNVASAVWDFGDNSSVSNTFTATHNWQSPGQYTVTLTAYNAANPAGVSGSTIVQVVTQPVHYVSQSSTNPVSPYSSWATAATNIQDAVDATSYTAGELVLVSNGVYNLGGRTVSTNLLTNRLVVTNPVIVESLNGPLATVIQGSPSSSSNSFGPGAVRCAWLGADAQLIGFTLQGGSTLATGSFDGFAGGVWCSSNTAELADCIICSNSAWETCGGVFSGVAEDCVLSNNSATYGINGGGGAYGSILENCVITGNTADNGGGASQSFLYNCTVIGNQVGAVNSTNWNCIFYNNYNGDGLGNTYIFCDVKTPWLGIGNITNTPLFVDYTNGNFRLQSNSPCINAGSNAYVMGTTDLDGNARISGGTVDMGAYEFQNPTSVISYAWLEQYGLPTDGSADYADTDHTGMNNWQKWVAGLNPTNSASVLQLMAPAGTGTNLVITWQSVTNINYFLARSASLAPGSFQTIVTNIAGQAGTTSYTDTNAPAPGPWFYRVGVP